jgi:hypothetical protein
LESARGADFFIFIQSVATDWIAKRFNLVQVFLFDKIPKKIILLGQNIYNLSINKPIIWRFDYEYGKQTS